MILCGTAAAPVDLHHVYEHDVNMCGGSVQLAAGVFRVRTMHVRSFEIHEVADTDLRRLHDYLLEVGGFEFRAGGSGFFALVGERFIASTGATNGQMVMASREADTINVDVVAAGGGRDDTANQLAAVQRATELLRGFAERSDLSIIDI